MRQGRLNIPTHRTPQKPLEGEEKKIITRTITGKLYHEFFYNNILELAFSKVINV